MRYSTAFAVLTVMFGVSIAKAQEPPRSSVRYEAPSKSLISARYECRGTPVTLSLQTTSESIRVSELAVGGNDLNPTDQDRWNAELSAIKDFSSYGFSCLGGDFVALSIRGRTSSQSAVVVVTEWRQGRLYVDPVRPAH